MIADFRFFLKVSQKDFHFDLSQYPAKVQLQSSGLVFLSNDPESVTITESPDHVTIAIGSLRHSGVTFTWNKHTRTLDVKTDPFGIMNVFVYRNDDFHCYSNQIFILQRAFPERVLDSESLNLFLGLGFLPPGRTFWRNVERLQSRWTSRLCSPTVQSKKEIAHRHLEALQRACKILADDWKPDQIRVSGGIDSRLVSWLWPAEERSRINAVVVHSHWMESGKDLDVNVSRAWADAIEMPHQTLFPDRTQFGFFFGHHGHRIVSGLCGGEFLGGQFAEVIPSSPQTWQRHGFSGTLTADAEDQLLDHPWIQDMANDEEVWLSECARTFIQSSRSVIYHSVFGSWSNPSALHCVTASPFVNSEYLREWLSTPLEWLRDYDFYDQVFQLLDHKLSSFPLSSQFCSRRPDLAAAAHWGLEPKSQMPKPPRGHTHPKADLDFLFHVLETQDIPHDPHRISQFLDQPGGLLRVMNLVVWLKAQFPQMRV